MRIKTIAVVLACAPLLQGCGLRAGAATDALPLEIRVAILDASGENQSAFSAETIITFELVVKNTGDTPAAVEFASSCLSWSSVLTSAGRLRISLTFDHTTCSTGSAANDADPHLLPLPDMR